MIKRNSVIDGAIIVCALTCALAACSSGPTTAKATGVVKQATPATLRLPTQILGLKVAKEDIRKQLGQIRGAYFDSVSLLGFRQGTILRAALQVGHFNSLARPSDPAFQNTIVQKVGATVPQRLKLGNGFVWMSPGQIQIQFTWFSGDWMYLLTLRRDFPFGRTLLRRLVIASHLS